MATPFLISACLAQSDLGGSQDDKERAVAELSASEHRSLERSWFSGAFEGSLSFRLSWEGEADLDLFVVTPQNEVLYYGNRRGGSGGLFSKNACGAACVGSRSEEVSWVEAAPQGRYRFYVERYDERASSDVLVELFRDGAIEQTFAVEELGAEAGARSEVTSVEIAPASVPSTFTGELAIQLTWDGTADLDLFVENPAGERIYYDRTTDSAGAQFAKNTCLSQSCAHDQSEEIMWHKGALKGEYKIGVERYGAGEASNARLLVHHRGQLERALIVEVPSDRGERAAIGSFELRGTSAPPTPTEPTPITPSEAALSSHRDREWIRGQRTNFELTATDSVERIALLVNDEMIWEGAPKAEMRVEHTFEKLGQQSVEVVSVGGGQQRSTSRTYTIVVTDEQGGLPRRGRAEANDVSRSLLASRLLTLEGVTLDASHHEPTPSGEPDGAEARANVLDSVDGPAKRSSHGGAPGGTVELSEAMLQFMVMLHDQHGHSYRVRALAGGVHRAGRHYDGSAVDISHLDGQPISRSSGANNRTLTRICREHGALSVSSLFFAVRPDHIQCAWAPGS